jgi:Asp/Glu/hydantoin racemase
VVSFPDAVHGKPLPWDHKHIALWNLPYYAETRCSPRSTEFAALAKRDGRRAMKATESETPRLALISATPVAIAPATDGLVGEFPGARIWNILDDRLLVEAAEQGGLSERLHQRMARLIEHAKSEGASGILLTCSMYGPVAHDLDEARLPVLAADDAVFAAVIESGHRSVLIVSSLEPALRDASQRFELAVRDAGATVHVAGLVVEDAFVLSGSGDMAALAASLAAAIAPVAADVDAVLLSQYSLSPAADALSAALGLPVFSGPKSAAALLRSRIASGAAAS